MIYQTIPLNVPGSMDYARAVTYLISSSDKIKLEKRPLVIICPGGGYAYTSEREGEMLALKWNSCGYHAIVVWYSCAPAVYPAALLELASVVKLAREHAEEWYIDSDKIIVQGSSAGGHLAASLGMFWKKKSELFATIGAKPEEIRPNGMILNYPVITSGEYAHRGSFENLLGNGYDELADEMSLENQVTEDTPMAFIWTTDEDRSVPAENSLLLAMNMRKAGIPVELHMYREGNHGLALANETTETSDGRGNVPSVQSWFELAHTWMKNIAGY